MDIQLAFQNADVLRAIIAAGPGIQLGQLAADTDRDQSNLRRTIERMEKAGIVAREPGSLTVADAALPIIAAADIAEGKAPPPPAGFTSLFHAQIAPDPLNPRRDLDSEEFKEQLDELRQDILQNGLLQNLVVRLAEPCAYVKVLDDSGKELPLYRLVSGERRWRALHAAIADGDWPDDRPVPVQIIETDDLGHRLRAFAENKQRRDLSPVEEALFYKTLQDRDGWTTEQIAEQATVSQRQVQLRLQLLSLSERDQQRMSLPKEHPDHLSVRDAKKKLQVAKPVTLAKPSDRPAIERLILAETLLKCAREGNSDGYYKTEIAHDNSRNIVEGEALASLKAQSLVYPSGPDLQTGRHSLQVYYAARNWLKEAYRDIEGEPGSVEYLSAVVTSILIEIFGPEEAAAVTTAGTYKLSWLNGPFELSEEGKLRLAESEARKAKQEAEAAERASESKRLLAAGATAQAIMEEVEASLATRTEFAAVDGRLALVMETAEAPLPWGMRADGAVVSANGSVVITGKLGAEMSNARLRAMVAGLNAAAGLLTPPEASTERIWPRSAFVQAMAAHLGDGDEFMPEDQAAAYARETLEIMLKGRGVVYGAEPITWDGDLAASLVDDRLAQRGHFEPALFDEEA
ncbi:ParB/RepB/Spo0J family partition protein [Caulobacter endophyticus]|uniref:ParB-like N-terminal domain-containing protein n=1 Tax=Caulobacter endophyticus TaxID=2172652 RepID=A0A2T9K423_9CAUL|nr:ParB/RepB/Spo0J family partition protein [Caulobacter endophyticus]PVM90684.1 hypothetical protein DDF67_09650 [Caulobacter endophyticus]